MANKTRYPAGFVQYLVDTALEKLNEEGSYSFMSSADVVETQVLTIKDVTYLERKEYTLPPARKCNERLQGPQSKHRWR